MTEELKRLENESDFEYGLRLIKIKVEDKPDNLEWADMVSMMGLTIHYDTLRKAVQAPFGGYQTLKFFEDKKIDNIVDTAGDEYIQKFVKAKEESYKEKVKLQDERRMYNAFVRVEARWEEMKDVVQEEARNLNTTKPLLSNRTSVKSGEQIASLLLSDLHLGIEVDTYLNTYNIEIAKEYLKTLELKTIEYCKIHNVRELNLEILGDLVSGIIHVTTRLYQQETIINQTMICAEMLAEMIHNLSDKLEKINIYFSVGNHARVVANYKEHMSEENFEYLILWHLKTRLKDVNNIEFKENIYDSEMITYVVFGKKIISIHGHKDRPESAVIKLSQMLGVLFDECHMGHFHNFAFKSKTLINGAFVGLDQFAQDHRFSGTPSQVMKIYYENGDECIYDIGFRTIK
ncbi:hypothetical protein [Clostridium sp.]|uniref:hypothetical protein n=1 Tax=Clostridium sp. TaxID=1506 RepID=UPI001A48DD06|nr:hypothetical protein [Clostridium sp.]MBK5239801.1 hypothetical protein [Clostridium sp.]